MGMAISSRATSPSSIRRRPVKPACLDGSCQLWPLAVGLPPALNLCELCDRLHATQESPHGGSLGFQAQAASALALCADPVVRDDAQAVYPFYERWLTDNVHSATRKVKKIFLALLPEFF